MKVPGYLHHKPTGQARVIVRGKTHYLGKYGSPESRQKYERLIGEYLANGRQEAPRSSDGRLAVRQLAAVYWNHCEGYYARSEHPGLKAMIKRVNDVAGDLAAEDFRPSTLKLVREAMIKALTPALRREIERAGFAAPLVPGARTDEGVAAHPV